MINMYGLILTLLTLNLAFAKSCSPVSKIVQKYKDGHSNKLNSELFEGKYYYKPDKHIKVTQEAIDSKLVFDAYDLALMASVPTEGCASDFLSRDSQNSGSDLGDKNLAKAVYNIATKGQQEVVPVTNDQTNNLHIMVDGNDWFIRGWDSDSINLNSAFSEAAKLGL